VPLSAEADVDRLRRVGTILVTGSSDGIGRQTARSLIAAGHRVVLHARNEQRASETRAAAAGASAVVVGDLSSIAETKALAQSANSQGPYDAIIHNAGVGGGSGPRQVTADGLERIFAINTLAPYILTALMPRAPRMVYLSSGLQANGVADLSDLQYERKRYDGRQAYCDSKLHDVMLAFAVARRFPQVVSSAVDPGWVKTKMGGPGATNELDEGAETPVWLATSDEVQATTSGRLLKSRRPVVANPAASDITLQDGLLDACAHLSGVTIE
jgi:NAD(P)-dependent dehydrogenase (short-subunit alcohol dehydrogenase family)